MCRKYNWIGLLVLLFFSRDIAASEVTAVIVKSPTGSWSVNYTTDAPVTRIAFQRSPDSSRVNRWKTKSADFRVTHTSGYETVSRVDGNPFTQVALELTPTYIPLPKDYAPFSPFTDDGMLLHSGRFFACAERCDGSVNEWHLSIQATEDDNIIVDGVIYTGHASWIDSNSGQKVYVGKGEPIQDENFVSLIDSGLPTSLKNLMSYNLPKILDYFATRLEALNYRPSLYASYSQTDDGSYGHQGGTLPGQIFMHWYGETSIANLNENATFWFFAHEVAHLYQGKAGRVEALTDAWIHEGSAELFAGIAYTEINGDSQLFSNVLDNAKNSCVSIFEHEKSYRQAALTNTRVHYSCGLVIFDAINHALETQEQDIFALWKAFNAAVEQGKPASSVTFIEVLKPFISNESWLLFEDFVSNPEVDASTFFQHLANHKLKPPS